MERFDIYEAKPAGMETYLRNYGWHFSKKMYEFAVSNMKDKNKKSVQPVDRENLKAQMNNAGFKDEFAGYDACYVYSMAKSDFYGSTLMSEPQIYSFVNDYLPGHTKPNIFQRIWRAIISKPTYYAETITNNKEQVLEFLHDCIDIIGEEDVGTQTE